MIMSKDFPENLQIALADGTVTLDDAVIRLADADSERDIAVLIGARLSIEQDVIVRALAAHWQEAAAMLCRTAGIGTNGYSAVLRMRRRAGRTLDASPAALLAAYLQRRKASREELTELLHTYRRQTAEQA